jgi:hypothetical protein
MVRGIPNVEVQYHELTNGALVFEFKFPSGTLGRELSHLKEHEYQEVLQAMLQQCAATFRRVRERRRGPTWDPKEILWGRKEEKDPLG